MKLQSELLYFYFSAGFALQYLYRLSRRALYQEKQYQNSDFDIVFLDIELGDSIINR